MAPPPIGDLRWKEDEDALLVAYYPDYAGLRKFLPHRTLPALKYRVQALGIAKSRHVWTNKEVERLHAAYASGAPDCELERLFPTLSLVQIKSKAGHVGVRRRKATPLHFGVPALDAIRSQAAKSGISFVELDLRAGTGRFFQKSSRRLCLKHIVRAAACLGAEVEIEWSE